MLPTLSSFAQKVRAYLYPNRNGLAKLSCCAEWHVRTVVFDDRTLVARGGAGWRGGPGLPKSTASVAECRSVVGTGINLLHPRLCRRKWDAGMTPRVSRCLPQRSFRRYRSSGMPALPRPRTQPPIPAGRPSSTPQGTSSSGPPSGCVALQQWSAALKFVASAAKVTLRFGRSSVGILAVAPSMASMISIAGVCVLGKLT